MLFSRLKTHVLRKIEKDTVKTVFEKDLLNGLQCLKKMYICVREKKQKTEKVLKRISRVVGFSGAYL